MLALVFIALTRDYPVALRIASPNIISVICLFRIIELSKILIDLGISFIRYIV